MRVKRKIGRNDPCPCGSGKKFKVCHFGQEHELPLGHLRGAQTTLSLDPSKLKLAPGLSVTDFKATMQMVSVKESPMPMWYLGLAFDAARACRDGSGGQAGSLNTVLLTVLAAEALVNRLLEPLTRKDWDKTESKSLVTKWARLSREIALKPELAADLAPLKPLADLAQLRNELVHFKFGRNMAVAEQDLPATHGRTATEGFTSTIRFPDKAVVKMPVTKDSPLPDQLHPGKAWDYFMSLIDVLRPVLAGYPQDPFGTREELLDVIRQVDAVNAVAHSAP